MADLTPKKIILSEINNGQQYENGDGVQPNAINDPIQASAYAQALATTQPNLDNVDNFGTPSVSIEEVNGLPRFKFENLNAVEIASVEQTKFSNESSGENVMTVTLNNGDIKNFPFYNGATGAKLISRVLQGQDQDGGNIYLDTFDDGTTIYFTAPKGSKGDTYTLTENDKDEISKITAPLAAPLTAPLTEPYVDKVVEAEIKEQMIEATKGFTVIENVSNLAIANINFLKGYVSYNKLNGHVTLRLVGTANELNATTSLNIATMSDIFVPSAIVQKEVLVGEKNTVVSVGTNGFITFSSESILNGDFDIEIIWELPSDSLIGTLSLMSAETVNINSVVKKGDITTINLDATFVDKGIRIYSSFESSDTVFYISDAFNISNREFTCECVLKNASSGTYNESIPFSIKNGECRPIENPISPTVAFLSAIHNLQLQFNARSVPDLSISSGGTIEATDNGTYMQGDFVNLSLSLVTEDAIRTTDKIIVCSITPIYAPLTTVEVALSFTSGIVTFVSGILQINPTGIIYFLPNETTDRGRLSADLSVSYRYKNS